MPLLIALLTCLALPLLASSCTSASRGARPDPTPEAELPVAERLRVMSFNIQSAAHGVDQVAGLIKEEAPDVVALQEVDLGTTRAKGTDQTEAIAAVAGFPHHLFFKATRLLGGEYGIALLSRYPIRYSRQLALPTPPGVEPRTVAQVILDVNGSEVSVYLTHLSNLARRSELRLIQASFIARMMQDDHRPKMLLGDFNDEPDAPALLLLKHKLTDVLATRGHGSEVTYPMPLFLSDIRLDYVMSSSELSPKDAFVVRKVASDHFPLVADFAIPSAPSAVGIR
jgi:endonuclease/exonuclease/phosphatase family metal-dependent hydrolase